MPVEDIFQAVLNYDMKGIADIVEAELDAETDSLHLWMRLGDDLARAISLSPRCYGLQRQCKADWRC